MAAYTIGIIGAGNVGSHLSRAFSASGHKIVVYTRRGATHLLEDVKGLVWTEHLQSFKRGFDFIIITVNDSAIADVAKELDVEEGIVLHASGSTGIEVLGNLSDFGVFYPLQSFRKNLPLNYREIPVFIEGNSAENQNKIELLAHDFSNSVIGMNSLQRQRLHLAAVVVNNFSNHLYMLSQEFLNEHKITFKHLLPLIKETASRLENQKPSELQTGPAKRHDKTVMNEHMEMLSNDQDLLEIYKVISSSIGKWHKK